MTLKEKLEQLIQEYKAKYSSPDAILVLQKTFQSHNITIEDWNSLITFINNNLDSTAVKDIYDILINVVDEIDIIEEILPTKADKSTTYTKTDVDTALDLKTDKVDVLPYFNVSTTDNVLDFINNNQVNKKPIILYLDAKPLIGYFNLTTQTVNSITLTYITFELEDLADSNRYYGLITENTSDVTFNDIISNTYKKKYALDTGILTEQETLDILRGN